MPDIDTSRLSAINTILATIGEAPVSSLTEGVTLEVSMAVAALDRVNKELQVQGWQWNTDEEVTITRGANLRFAWQSNWIRFDTAPNAYNIDVVRRGEYLYNRKRATFEFSQTTLVGVAVVYLDWDDLPEAARQFVLTRAARMFQDQIQGDEARHVYSKEDQDEAWARLMEEELEQSDANILNGGVAGQVRFRRGGDGLSDSMIQ